MCPNRQSQRRHKQELQVKAHQPSLSSTAGMHGGGGASGWVLAPKDLLGFGGGGAFSSSLCPNDLKTLLSKALLSPWTPSPAAVLGVSTSPLVPTE
jgi:hypothetical protein